MARRRGDKWQADCVVDGKRIRPQFNTEAEAIAFERNAAHMKARDESSIGRLFPTLCAELWSNTKDYDGARSITKDLINRIGYSLPVYKIDERVIDHLVNDYRREGKADQTINNKLTRLSKLLKIAKRKRLLTSLPEIILNPQKDEGRIRFLTEDEELRLFSQMDEEAYHFCRFLLYTGCRYGEAFRLHWQDISDQGVTFWITKGGKPRTVPLTTPVRQAIAWARAHKHNQAGPFTDMTYTILRRRWAHAKQAAGFTHDKQVIPHILRHTCACRLVQRGIDLRRVKDWLGHADITTTLRYARLAPGDLEQAARALDSK
jgi:integrase